MGEKTGEIMVMPTVSMTVNGQKVSGEVEARTLLVQFLRENLRLTGTHVGCDTSQCGACVVHVNGNSAKSCTMLAVQAMDAEITTIEGLADGDTLLVGDRGGFVERKTSLAQAFLALPAKKAILARAQ